MSEIESETFALLKLDLLFGISILNKNLLQMIDL